MANNGQAEEPPIEVNIAPLMQAQKHLRIALQLIQSQPPVNPLDTVRVFAQGAEAILSQALAEVTRDKPGLVIPPAGLKI